MMEGGGVPANFRPLSMEAWELSTTVTGTPALRAATNAIPRPWEVLILIYIKVCILSLRHTI